MKRITRILGIAILLLVVVVAALTASFAQAIRGMHSDFQAEGHLPPPTLTEILVALHPDPVGTSSPVRCALTLVSDEIRDVLELGPSIHVSRAYECLAPAPIAAAAQVLDQLDLPTTFVPLSLASEVAYRFVPESVLIDLLVQDYVQRSDLRTLSQEYLGIDLEQASPRELVWLMAKMDTAFQCKHLENPYIVRTSFEQTCEDVVAQRFDELSEELAKAGYTLKS